MIHDSGKIIITNKGISIGVIFLKPVHIDPPYHVQTITTLFSTALNLKIPFMLVAERAGNTLK